MLSQTHAQDSLSAEADHRGQRPANARLASEDETRNTAGRPDRVCMPTSRNSPVPAGGVFRPASLNPRLRRYRESRQIFTDGKYPHAGGLPTDQLCGRPRCGRHRCRHAESHRSHLDGRTERPACSHPDTGVDSTYSRCHRYRCGRSEGDRGHADGRSSRRNLLVRALGARAKGHFVHNASANTTCPHPNADHA